MTLEQIQALVINDLQAVEHKIQDMLQSDVALIGDIGQHITQGGKRIRPLVALLMGQALGDTTQPQILLASIVEFIHTATLLHDDVVDNSTLRRGAATANHIWGNDASVLVGDFLYSRAFQLLVEMNEHKLMVILANTMNIMAEGEVLQLMNRHDINIDENIYFRIVHAKTAVLFQATCEMAATLAKSNTAITQCAADFGRHIGLIFQLIDDALDYAGNATELGKNIGDDLAEGKMTLPLIHALHHANSEEKQLLGHIIATGEVEQLDAVKRIIDRHQSVEYTLALAKQHQQLALHALQTLPESSYKTGLVELTEFILTRCY
jgi:octaprenyl-diphosphate synthase